jgi:hypothetical protein
MGNSQDDPVLYDVLCSHGETDSLSHFGMPPRPLDLIGYAGALRTYALGFSADAGITVPREWLLALIDTVIPGPTGSRTGESCPDHRISDLVDRLGRKESTIRQMCTDREFEMPIKDKSAYKYRNKEWKIPEAAVLAYEARQRVGRSPTLDNLSDWRTTKSPKPRRNYAA